MTDMVMTVVFLIVRVKMGQLQHGHSSVNNVQGPLTSRRTLIGAPKRGHGLLQVEQYCADCSSIDIAS